MARLSVKQRAPLRKSFMPSRRQRRHLASRYRAMAAPYTRRRFGGRQPSCGIGVTSRMAVISSPTACSDRMAASRPAPGPFTNTSIDFKPNSIALRAAVWAANGVLLREPLNPALPALDHDTTLPILSVSVTIVLLKVAWMCATPVRTSRRSRFLPPFLRGAWGWSAMAYAPGFLGAAGAGAAGAAAVGFFLTITPLRGPFRLRALAAHGEAPAVADAPVRADVHEPLHVHGHVAPQVTLDLQFALDDLAHACRLIVGPGFHALAGIDARLVQHPLGRRLPDAIDVRERDLTPLLPRQIHSSDPCHMSLHLPRSSAGFAGPPPTSPLTLLVPWVLADDARHAAPLDDLAVLAAHLHRRSYFHRARLAFIALSRLTLIALSSSLCRAAANAAATLPGGGSGRGAEPPPGHLNRYVMRPRVRSYGDNSTFT